MDGTELLRLSVRAGLEKAADQQIMLRRAILQKPINWAQVLNRAIDLLGEAGEIVAAASSAVDLTAGVTTSDERGVSDG